MEKSLKDAGSSPVLVPEIVVAGRKFRPPTRTSLRQDMYMSERLEAADLDDLMDRFDPKAGKLDKAGESAVLQAYRNGVLFDVLAGVLVEDGKKWSPEEAKRNAEFFANLEEEEDKAAVRGPMVATILFFFIGGIRSPEILVTSSRESGESHESSEIKPDQLSSDDGGRIEEHTISGSGTISSEPAPILTPINTTES